MAVLPTPPPLFNCYFFIPPPGVACSQLLPRLTALHGSAAKVAVAANAIAAAVNSTWLIVALSFSSRIHSALPYDVLAMTTLLLQQCLG